MNIQQAIDKLNDIDARVQKIETMIEEEKQKQPEPKQSEPKP